MPAAQALRPDIAIQLDLMLATDTPDMQARGDLALGGGPGMSLYSFHGRGTLNGTIPHPALVSLFERAAAPSGFAAAAQRCRLACSPTRPMCSSSIDGIAAIDLGFPCRYTHSALEVCDLSDLVGLAALLVTGLSSLEADFSLDRDDYPE